MKYRCTARFAKAFDRLDADTRARALRLIQRFAEAPRVPHRDIRLVVREDPVDVWALPMGDGCFMTYSFRPAEDDDEVVCVLHTIGRADGAEPSV